MKWYFIVLLALTTACSEPTGSGKKQTAQKLPEPESGSNQDEDQAFSQNNTSTTDSMDVEMTDVISEEEPPPPPQSLDLPPPPADEDVILEEEDDIEVEKAEPTAPKGVASFPGGSAKLADYYRRNFVYPQRAKDIGLEGKVYVRFTVNPDGSISNARVIKKFDALLDEAAIEFIEKMPNWIPASQDGKKVKDEITLPVDFRLK